MIEIAKASSYWSNVNGWIQKSSIPRSPPPYVGQSGGTPGQPDSSWSSHSQSLTDKKYNTAAMLAQLVWQNLHCNRSPRPLLPTLSALTPQATQSQPHPCYPPSPQSSSSFADCPLMKDTIEGTLGSGRHYQLLRRNRYYVMMCRCSAVSSRA